MTDPQIERLTAPSAMAGGLKPIPWQPGTAPAPVGHVAAGPTDPLPKVDVILWAYTVAEAEALADVYTPGRHWTDWQPYAREWDSYVPQFTGRSPARQEKCLAYYWLTQVGGKTVLVLKNSLHLDTDGPSIPLRQFWKQIITEAQPSLVIDSGTAGGIGADLNVGDTVVAGALRFDCNERFKTEPFAHESFPTTAKVPAAWRQTLDLIAVNAGLLAPQTMVPLKIVGGHVLSTDFFAEDTADDKYGLRAYDPLARAVEMDASVLGLVAGDLGSAMPVFTSLRSVSDPQMPAGSSETSASKIYLRYGYAAQVATCISAHAVITGS